MLKCINTLELPTRSFLAVVAVLGGLLQVCVASTSMFSGNDTARSMNDRERTNARAFTALRPLNSGTSVVKRSETSITGASPSPRALISNDIKMAS